MAKGFNIAKLRDLALQHGDTNSDGNPSPLAIASRTGVDPGLVSRILNDKRGAGRITITKFSAAYGAPKGEFYLDEIAA